MRAVVVGRVAVRVDVFLVCVVAVRAVVVGRVIARVVLSLVVAERLATLLLDALTRCIVERDCVALYCAFSESGVFVRFVAVRCCVSRR